MSKTPSMQQLVALAAKGNPNAIWLLNTQRSLVQNQDDQVTLPSLCPLLTPPKWVGSDPTVSVLPTTESLVVCMCTS